MILQHVRSRFRAIPCGLTELLVHPRTIFLIGHFVTRISNNTNPLLEAFEGCILVHNRLNPSKGLIEPDEGNVILAGHTRFQPFLGGYNFGAVAELNRSTLDFLCGDGGSAIVANVGLDFCGASKSLTLILAPIKGAMTCCYEKVIPDQLAGAHGPPFVIRFLALVAHKELNDG